jgi:hypothetical protein
LAIRTQCGSSGRGILDGPCRLHGLLEREPERHIVGSDLLRNLSDRGLYRRGRGPIRARLVFLRSRVLEPAHRDHRSAANDPYRENDNREPSEPDPQQGPEDFPRECQDGPLEELTVGQVPDRPHIEERLDLSQDEATSSSDRHDIRSSPSRLTVPRRSGIGLFNIIYNVAGIVGGSQPDQDLKRIPIVAEDLA